MTLSDDSYQQDSVSQHPTIVFTLRVWPEQVTPEVVEWRGTLREISSGQAYPFRNWSELMLSLKQLLPDAGETTARD